MPKLKSTTEQSNITYEDLPPKTRLSIGKIIENRRLLGLPDDSVERKQRAIEYFMWQQEKQFGGK